MRMKEIFTAKSIEEAKHLAVEKFGVSEDQIPIVSYGKEKPEVLGHDEAAYSKNRRAVLVY